MLVQIIGDVHGTSTWKQACNLNEFQKIVFIGDYFDSFSITGRTCRENFMEILAFKASNPDKVVLLMGNHDNGYLFYHTSLFKAVKCSGFSSSNAWVNNKLLIENRHFLQAAWQCDNTLITHAGVTEGFFQKCLRPFWDNSMPISELLNAMWQNGNRRIFQIGEAREGEDMHPGIFWTDKTELLKDPLLGYTQIVGHTPVPSVESHNFTKNTQIIFTDCVEHSKLEFLVINT